MQQEDAALLSVDELKSRIETLLRRKREQSDVLVFLETTVGKRLLAEKQQAIHKVRDEYAKMDVDAPPEILRGRLIANITRENLLRSDLRVLESAKTLMEGLDMDLQICNDMLRAKGRTVATDR